MTKRTMKVASFAPELIELFRRGVRERVRITLSSEKEAQRSRQRLYDLRRAMRNEKHSLVEIAERAQARVEGSVLIVEPKDFDIAKTLRKAGITTDTALDETPLPGEPITDEAATAALREYLDK